MSINLEDIVCVRKQSHICLPPLTSRFSICGMSVDISDINRRSIWSSFFIRCIHVQIPIYLSPTDSIHIACTKNKSIVPWFMLYTSSYTPRVSRRKKAGMTTHRRPNQNEVSNLIVSLSNSWLKP